MSVRAMSWAFDRDIPPRDRFVLVALCNFADDEGRCWPKQTTIARMTGYRRETVNAALRALEGDHHLIRSDQEHRDDGGMMHKTYQLTPLLATRTGGCESGAQGGVRDTHSKNHQVGTISKEPKPKPSSADADARTNGSLSKDDYDRVMRAYNDHRGPLPEARVMNSKRRSMVRTAAADLGGVDEVAAALAVAAREVADDPRRFYERNGYGIDTLLTGQKFIQKAEAAMARGGTDRDASERNRMMEAIADL